jgi:hypothetical protein
MRQPREIITLSPGNRITRVVWGRMTLPDGQVSGKITRNCVTLLVIRDGADWRLASPAEMNARIQEGKDRMTKPQGMTPRERGQKSRDVLLERQRQNHHIRNGSE